MPIPADYKELSTTGLDPRHVEALWSFDASSPGEHIVLPDGRMDLIARYRLGATGRIAAMEPAIIGPSQRPSRVPVKAGDCFLGLRYRAGWGGACLGVDPSPLRDGGLYGRAVLDVLGTDVLPIRRAETPDELKNAMIQIGRRRAEPLMGQVPACTMKAIDLLHLTGGRLALSDVSLAIGVPERTLRRHIGAAVGLSFKSLAAVLRFQRTVRLLAAFPGSKLTLAQAALEGGYSDQAHMTREFRRYGGFTPGKRPPVALGSLPIGQVAEMFKTDAARAA